jgi:hypothetical protein
LNVAAATTTAAATVTRAQILDAHFWLGHNKQKERFYGRKQTALQRFKDARESV